MKAKKILSLIIAASMALQCVALSALAVDENEGVTLIANDIDTDWQMMYNWARFEDGFGYHSTWSVEDGFKLTHDSDKHYAADAVKYLEGSVYKFKVDKETKLPVASTASDDSADTYSWYYNNRHSYLAEFVVGEEEADPRPAVISFTFRTTNPATSFWGNEPATAIEIVGQYTTFENQKLQFQIFPNYGGKGLQIAYYDPATSSKTYKQLGLPKDEMEHDIKLAISPELTTDGRYIMEAISVDGVVTKLENVYGLTAGMSDMLINRINYKAGIRVKPSYEDEIKNLKVERGLEAMVLSTDFVDGDELVDGINIISSSYLQESALNDSIKVYDCDFDDELIADPGMVITYNDGIANVKFTKLESGGNYRMEITDIKDAWGNEYTDTFSVNFATPQGESGGIEDTPDSEGGSEGILAGDINIASSNTSYHGHGFYTATKTDNLYDIVIATEAWWNAEQNKYGKDNRYYYLDENGNEKLLGYGNNDWNKLDLEIGVGESINNGEPLVVSYDWYSENFGSLGEWSTNSMNVMGIQCYLSDSDLAQAMFKYYRNGTTVAEKVDLAASSDGWHNVKLVFSPQLKDGRCKLDAIVLDGNITFFDNVYSTVSDYTEDTFVLKNLKITIEKPRETSSGEGVVKIRNIDIKRIDGLAAEMFMPLGVQNPKEAIKLNFNYPISASLTPEDITIYEIAEQNAGEEVKEIAISNTLSLSKAYDGKQLVINVGDGGLYYNKKYKLVINKNIIVEDYISLTGKEYEFSTYEYPDDLTVELIRNGDAVDYNISGGGDSFVIMVSTYDAEGALVGINSVNAQKEGSGNRRKARGSIEISNASEGTKVLVYIFTGDGTMSLYRMPTEV